MPRTATVKRLTFPEGRRVLAISDIHGNLPFLKVVLAAAHYGPDDILVLVGDLVEKGRTASPPSGSSWSWRSGTRCTACGATATTW